MFRLLLAFFIAAGLAWVPATAAGPVEQERVEAAERLLDAVGHDSQMDAVLEMLIGQMQKTLPAQINARLDKPLPDELMQRLLKITDAHVRKSFGESRSDLKHATALIYASQFSAAELDRLVELQSDPVMKKFQEKAPELVAQSMALGQGLSERDRPALESAIKAAIEDYFRSRGEVAPTISSAAGPRTSATS